MIARKKINDKNLLELSFWFVYAIQTNIYSKTSQTGNGHHYFCKWVCRKRESTGNWKVLKGGKKQVRRKLEKKILKIAGFQRISSRLPIWKCKFSKWRVSIMFQIEEQLSQSVFELKRNLARADIDKLRLDLRKMSGNLSHNISFHAFLLLIISTEGPPVDLILKINSIRLLAIRRNRKIRWKLKTE